MAKTDEPLIGPEPVTREPFDSLIDLVDRVFRAGSERSMLTDYPYFFRRENHQNLFIFRAGARVVSHIGLLPVQLSFFGHPVRVGMIGGVATDPDYRGRGLATRLLHHIFDLWRRSGGQLMMISGGRGLYIRNGARSVGAFEQYVLGVPAWSPANVTAELCTPEAAPLLSALHRSKPFRFIRTLEEWRINMAELRCQGYPSDYYLVRRGGGPTAYFALTHRPDNDEGLCRMVEWGGSAADVIAALPEPARKVGCKKTWWRLHLHEHEARRDLLAAGAVPQGRALMQGTARVVDLEALMGALSGYVREVLGEEGAAPLSFHTRGEEQFAVRCGPDELAVSGHAALIELLFGTGVDGVPGGMDECPLKDALKKLLPLPMAQYDMTYS